MFISIQADELEAYHFVYAVSIRIGFPEQGNTASERIGIINPSELRGNSYQTHNHWVEHASEFICTPRHASLEGPFR